MTIHLTIWWLWWLLIAVYVFGLVAGMAGTLMMDTLQWWLRPLILIWPVAITAALLYRLTLFMVGRDG